MTTEEKVEQEVTPKKESAKVDKWKKDYLFVQDQLKSEVKEWQDKFYEADGELTKKNRKLEQAQAELAEWENKDNAEREPLSPTKMQKRREDEEKSVRMQRFLKRIKK